jgi:hypothetical protein
VDGSIQGLICGPSGAVDEEDYESSSGTFNLRPSKYRIM